MKLPKLSRGFTLTEFLVVLAVVLLLALLLPAWSSPKRKASRVDCMNNLKQVSTAFRLWGGGFGGTNGYYPAHVTTNTGGALELAAQGEVFRIFQVMSNELNTPKILICPADTRTAAASFGTLSNANLSYFVSADADEANPRMLLFGDRNLTLNGLTGLRGLVALPTNAPVGWVRTNLHRTEGFVGLADGSVQQATAARLRQFLAASGRTNRLVIP